MDALANVGENSKMEQKSNYPPPVSNHTCIYDKEKDSIYLFGGTNPMNKTYYNDLWILNCQNWTWTRVIPEEEHKHIPGERCGHIMKWWKKGKSFVVFGGCTSSARMNDLWLFDIESNLWQRVSTGGVVPTERNHHQGVLEGDNLYIYGGYPLDEEPMIYVIDLYAKVWEVISIKMNQEIPIPNPNDIDSIRKKHTPPTCYGHVMQQVPNRTEPDAEHPSFVIFGGVGAEANTLLGNQYIVEPSNTYRYESELSNLADELHELQCEYLPKHLMYAYDRLKHEASQPKTPDSIEDFGSISQNGSPIKQYEEHELSPVKSTISHYSAFTHATQATTRTHLSMFNNMSAKIYDNLILKMDSVEFNTHPDPKFQIRPILIKELRELLVQYKRLNSRARYHQDIHRKVIVSQQELIAEYLHVHRYLTSVDAIHQSHELLTFYAHTQKKLVELFLRYLNASQHAENPNSPARQFRISTCIISDQTITLVGEEYHLLFNITKRIHDMIRALKCRICSNVAQDISERMDLLILNQVAERFARILTLRYRRQIVHLSSNVTKIMDPKADVKSLGGVEILSECAIRRVLIWLEGESRDKDPLLTMYPSDMKDLRRFDELAQRLSWIVFHGGSETEFRETPATPLELSEEYLKEHPGKSIIWTAAGVLSQAGLEVTQEEDSPQDSKSALGKTKTDANEPDKIVYIGSFNAPYAAHARIYGYIALNMSEFRYITNLHPNVKLKVGESAEREQLESQIKSSSKRMNDDLNTLRSQLRKLKEEHIKAVREVEELQHIRLTYNEFREKSAVTEQLLNERLNDERDRYRKKLGSKEDEIEQLNAKLTSQHQEVEILSGKVLQLEDDIKHAREQSTTLQSYNQELISRNASMDEAQRESAKTPASPSNIQNSMTNLKSAIRESRMFDFETMYAQERLLKKQLADAHLEIAGIRKEMQRLKLEHDHSTKNISIRSSQYEEQIAALNEQITDERRLREHHIKSFKEDLEGKITMLKHAVSEKDMQLQRYTIERAKLQSVEDHLREEIENLNERLRESSDVVKIDKMIQDKNEELEQLGKRNEGLERTITMLEHDLAERTQTERLLQEQLNHAENESERMRERIQHLKSQQIDNRKMRKEMEKLQLMKRELDRVNKENLELKRDSVHMKKLMESAESRLKVFEEDSHNTRGRLEELTMAKTENTELKLEMKKMSSLIQTLQTRIQTLVKEKHNQA
eukprot:CAMPEP_0117420136 /NCGR_PEP_ID=MMETSP0758-20121206/1537_1 /TAXON_ID=63605 /ORGANISM="Percolomonas cosmopolitus, Strain AE-1 (ATCC 50343)" /LENGTH=1214 /DNA_ID=CAMNT_0005201577 /DNA_START=255 /DNA_END=3899 /DNA_ORIENTATION=-